MSKSLVYLLIGIGSLIGSYIPVLLWNASVISAASIIGGVIGGIAGVYASFKLAQYL